LPVFLLHIDRFLPEDKDISILLIFKEKQNEFAHSAKNHSPVWPKIIHQFGQKIKKHQIWKSIIA